MQAVVLVLLLGVSLCGVCGNEAERSSSDVLSIIRAMLALQTKVETLETSLVQVQSLVQQQSSSRVAFLAGFYDTDTRALYGPFTTATTIKFKKVVTNVGNGYNSETGLFTAPLRGVYVFHFKVDILKSTSASSSFVVLKKNTDYLVNAFDFVSDQDDYDSCSNTAVLTLEQGDTVSVELQPNSALHDNAGKDTTFSGFLLFPMPSTS